MREVLPLKRITADLDQRCAEHGRALIAEQAQVPRSFLSSVLTGKRRPSKKLLAYLGYRKIVGYVKLTED